MNGHTDHGGHWKTGSHNGLGVGITPLVGRECEIPMAISLLRRDHIRLLTLTGTGGIGKTRLALEITELLRDDFADGVCVVPLAAVAQSALVIPAIAQQLDHPMTGIHTRDVLVAALRDANILFVLDNFEHILDAAPIVHDLLVACPRVKVLATSRALLRISGEHALPVPPLELPDVRIATSAEEIIRSAAVRLFNDRAQAIVPSFTITAANAPVIAAICRRLDGLPLAIELAASQSFVLPPTALLDRIEARLPLPYGGPQDAPDRQRTLESTIAWSYALLAPDAQRLFHRVGVFVGGFPLEAASTVDQMIDASRDPGGIRSDAGGSARDVLIDLAALVDASLLQQTSDQTLRFTMLETIRAFALRQLATNGELAATRDAHASWCLDLAEQAHMASVIPGGEQQLRRLESEHGNIRAALGWLYEHGDADQLLRLAVALGEFWFEYNYYGEGRSWLERGLAATAHSSTPLHARALVHLALFVGCLGDLSRAWGLVNEGVTILRQEGDAVALSLALIWQGAVATLLGRLAEAEHVFDEVLGMSVSVPDPSLAAALSARALANLGRTAHARGDLNLAMVRYTTALQICEEHGYLLGAIRTLDDLGAAARDQGKHAESLASFQKSLSLMGGRGDLRMVIEALEGAAQAAVAWDQAPLAAHLLGAAAGLGDVFGVSTRVATDEVAHARVVRAVHEMLDDSAFDDAHSGGRRLTMEDAIAEVQAMSPPTALPVTHVTSGVTLTSREEEVLRLIAAGFSDREIAAQHYLSVRTIEAHVARIRTKLGVRTRAAAVAAGIVIPSTSPH